MKILYLHTDVARDGEVAALLQEMGNGLVEMTLSAKEQDKADDAEKLLAAIEMQRTEVVFALKYLPLVSIVCQAARVKYAAWIAAAYDPQIYSCTLLNSCNYIFMADYALYEEFASGDFPHLFYLPLGAGEKSVSFPLGEEKHYEYDLTMLQNIVTREQAPYNPLSLESPLKDATKGYLEGCIACRYQILALPSMAGGLPPYVREDLTAHFPPELDADSIETASHYYDYRYFNPMVTWADRDIHFHTMGKNKYFQKTLQRNGCKQDETIKLVRGSRVNLAIPHRNWQSGIPQLCWDILALGGFLLCGFRGDFPRLFPDVLPALFENEREMLSRGIYYLHHEKEREELAGRLALEVRERHSCRKRLEELLKKL